MPCSLFLFPQLGCNWECCKGWCKYRTARAVPTGRPHYYWLAHHVIFVTINMPHKEVTVWSDFSKLLIIDLKQFQMCENLLKMTDWVLLLTALQYPAAAAQLHSEKYRTALQHVLWILGVMTAVSHHLNIRLSGREHCYKQSLARG